MSTIATRTAEEPNVGPSTSVSASDVRTGLRAGVGRRTRVSKTAREVMTLFARAGAVVSVVLYMKSPGSADAQQTLVVALTIYWTAVAVTLTWVVDGFVRAVRGRFTRRS